MVLTVLEAFAFGCIGGAAGYAFAYLLPFAIGLANGSLVLDQVTVGRVLGLVGIAAIYVALGGIAAMILMAESIKVALIAGVGFEGVLRSAMTRIQQATPE